MKAPLRAVIWGGWARVARVGRCAGVWARLGALCCGLIAAGPGLAGAQTAATTASAPTGSSQDAAINAPALFAQHCASCHGADRLGALGPALLPQNLERLRKPEAARVLRQGRVATQMQGFADRLSPAQQQALVEYIYTPVQPEPVWRDADIAASRVVQQSVEARPVKPVFDADPLNLFVVVEAGDHHVSILDGDRLERIARSPTRFALHGGPKFSPDGRYVYFGSRDGWVSKFDLWGLRTVVEVRAGLNTRNVAVSADGRWVMVGNTLPAGLVLLDAELNWVASLATRGAAGGAAARVSAVYDAAPRASFVVALKDVAEVWELPYRDGAPTQVQRTPLADVLDDFYFDDSYAHVLGTTRPKPGAAAKAQVVNLDQRRVVAELDLPGMPHLGSGIAFDWQGRRVMATPNLQRGLITLIDTATWQTVASVPTLGPGFFLRSHERTNLAFADAMLSPQARDTLLVFDKQSLKEVARLRPEPGQTLAHVEFTRDGRFALASLMEAEGALIVYDTQTLREIKRLPMRKPIGKYNVWNKITRSEGTSH